MQLVAYQPDIPQNLGSLIRLCACFGAALHIIEPCGFIIDDKRMRRVAMDYYDLVAITRHSSWEQFLEFKKQSGARVLLLTTQASTPYSAFAFRPDDMLLLGRESAGVPAEVREAADAGLIIPLAAGARSLNVAMAGAIVLAEAVRQTKGTT